MKRSRATFLVALAASVSLTTLLACNAILGIDDPRFAPEAGVDGAGPSAVGADASAPDARDATSSSLAESCTGWFDCGYGYVVPLLKEGSECRFVARGTPVLLGADGTLSVTLADGGAAYGGTWRANGAGFIVESNGTTTCDPKPTPTPSSTCGIAQTSNTSSEHRTFTMQVAGKVDFAWNPFRAKDRVKVTRDTVDLLDTQCNAGVVSRTWDVAAGEVLDVTVLPGCDGTPNSAWTYTLGCPR